MRRTLLALVVLTGSALAARALVACASDDASVTGGDTDASTPRGDDGGASREDGGGTTEDGGTTKSDGAVAKDCPGTTPQSQPGETCVGFGPSADSCKNACGRSYGYVCVDGGPPGFTDCVRVSSSFLGETYCCTEDTCVAQPDQDKECSGVAGKPHRYQCPAGDDGGTVTPAAGCQEKGSGGSSAEKFYCCP